MSSTHDLWQEFEQLELEITRKIHLCAAIKANSESEEEKRNANFEINALYFENKIGNYLDPVNQSISYDKEKIKGIISEFRGQCGQESIIYYLKRYDETSNIFDKWRYASCYWELKKDPSYQNNALDCLLSGIEICLKQKRYDDSDSLLVKAFNFSRFYGLLDKRVQEKNRIIKLVLELIEAVNGTDDSSIMRRMVKVLSLIEDGISPQQAKHLISLLHNEAKVNQAKNMHSRSIAFLETSLDLCDKLEETERKEQEQAIHRMLAESFEKEAESELRKQGNIHYFVAFEHYRKARQWYRKLNDEPKIDEMTKKIDSLNLTDKMDITEYKTEIPRKRFASSNGYDLVKEITDYAKSLIPSLDDTAHEAKQDLDEHPLQFGVGHVNFGRKNPVSVANDEKSITDSQTIIGLNEKIQLSDHIIASSVQELEKDGKISAQDFIDVLSEYGLESNLLELIRHGIVRHFAEDYVSSVHILIPQVEATLRQVLKSIGSKLLKTKGKDNIMYKELGGLLAEEDTRNVLKEDFRKYLEVKFTEQKGMNLRNDVSHAILEYEEFNHVNSLSTIIAILLLAKRLL